MNFFQITGIQTVDLKDDSKAQENMLSTAPPDSEPGVPPMGSFQYVLTLQKVLDKILVGMKWWETTDAKQMQPHLFGTVENIWAGWCWETNSFMNSMTISHSSDKETQADLHPVHSFKLFPCPQHHSKIGKGGCLMNFLNSVWVLLHMRTACWLRDLRVLNVYEWEVITKSPRPTGPKRMKTRRQKTRFFPTHTKIKPRMQGTHFSDKRATIRERQFLTLITFKMQETNLLIKLFYDTKMW